MKLEKAIKGLQFEVKEAAGDGALDAVTYLQLGKEALKRERECRENMPREEWLLLPGETEK